MATFSYMEFTRTLTTLERCSALRSPRKFFVYCKELHRSFVLLAVLFLCSFKIRSHLALSHAYTREVCTNWWKVLPWPLKVVAEKALLCSLQCYSLCRCVCAVCMCVFVCARFCMCSAFAALALFFVKERKFVARLVPAFNCCIHLPTPALPQPLQQ